VSLGDIVIALVSLAVGYIIAWHFYQKQVKESKQQYDGLTKFITARIDWETRLLDFLSRVEGKNIEGEGRIAIKRDDQNKPERFELVRPQVINLDSADVKLQPSPSTVIVGRPPEPPESVRKDLGLKWNAEAGTDTNTQR
jgi:hypothetical protein